jgi:energy-coupling factor transporter ATP-binding protein EcfA2
MLRKLRIRRFKSIWEDHLDFGSVNLFIGPNGSGKSNILEALGVLSAVFSRGLEPSELDLKGIRLSLPHIFKSAFKGHDLPKTFRLEATFDHGRYDCGIRASASSTYLEFFSEALYDGDRQVFGRSMHGTKVRSREFVSGTLSRLPIDDWRSIWSFVGPIVEISDNFRAELDEFARYAIYSPQTAVMRGLAVDNRVVEPLGLTGSGLASAFEAAIKGEVTQEVNQLLRVVWSPGWADEIRIDDFDSNIVPSQVKSEGRVLYIRDQFMRGGRNYLSPFDASEGTLYLIFVGALLAHPETPNTFALDNVDGTLNPSLVRTLTSHIVRACVGDREARPRQIFMTSHHPSALDSFDIFDDAQRIFIANRVKESDGERASSRAIGSTHFRQFKPPRGRSKDEWMAAHGGKNLSELLLENRIRDAL